MRQISRFLAALGVAFAVCGANPAAAQPAPAGAVQLSTRVTVRLPSDQATLTVDGTLIPGSGTSRTFETRPLEPGTTGRYTITTSWEPNGYTTMTRTRTISVRAGETLTIDLTSEDPNDRVRVVYVPTPEDVAAEMVRLAGVTSDDVVFEPGCGDARITIAAVKGGAKRGIGIDIDPARVAESKANVEAAGLSDRIDIRLGDALDIPDLSEATVVMLYMGDHFNLLIRPLLWRELKVGSRVVSHRFKMGDWEPDRTVVVNPDLGGEYELHLWTVTEELKKKVQ